MNADSIYAFYGSLRRGMLNHRRYEKGLEFISVEVIQGYRLYAMDQYPYAVSTRNDSDIITAEIFRITDPGVERAIHDLEMSVGYYYDEINVGGRRVGIYLYKKAGHETLVKSGDWVKFFGS